MPSTRLTYAASCQKLRDLGLFDVDDPLPLPTRAPLCDDEGPPGVRFFRTFVGEGTDLSALTLRRTFFGRSEISNASFANTDLSESNLCWNDFGAVDFGKADLGDSDLRGSNFNDCSFVATNLRGADLRHSSFAKCDFTNADLTAAIAEAAQRASLALSDTQASVVDWREDAGPEPDGG